MAVRLLWLVVGANRIDADDCVCDPVVYLRMADNDVDGHWFTGWFGQPTSFLSVGYPALLAVVRIVSLGLLDSWQAAMVVNLAAGAVLIVGAWRVARLIAPDGAGAAAGVVAAWVMALFPDAVTATGLVMTELPAVAFLMVCTVALLEWHRRPDSWRWALTAAIAGSLAVWMRPAWLFLLPLVVAWMLWHRREALRGGGGWRQAAAAAAVCVALVTPLWWNNTVRVGAPAGITSATWPNLCFGATGTTTFLQRDECSEPLDGALVPPDGWEARSAVIAREQAWDDIGDSPLRWLAAMPVRLVRAFDLGGWGIEVATEWSPGLVAGWKTSVVRRVSQVAFVAVVALALLGWWRRRPRWHGVSWLVAAATLAGVAISFGQTRYGWPVTAVLLVPMGAHGLASLRGS